MQSLARFNLLDRASIALVTIFLLASGLQLDDGSRVCA